MPSTVESLKSLQSSLDRLAKRAIDNNSPTALVCDVAQQVRNAMMGAVSRPNDLVAIIATICECERSLELLRENLETQCQAEIETEHV